MEQYMLYRFAMCDVTQHNAMQEATRLFYWQVDSRANNFNFSMRQLVTAKYYRSHSAAT